MVSNKFCPSCKQKNPLNASRCIHCNAPLETSQPGAISTTTQIGRTQSELLTESSQRLPPSFELPVNVLAVFELTSQEPFAKTDRTEVVLGRDRSAPGEEGLIDLTPLGASQLGVSRRHALIRRVNDGYTIEDLHSTNGTWVNEFRLVSGRAYPLNSGALVRLGQLTLQTHFRSGETPEDILLLSEAKHAPTLARVILTPRYLKETVHPFLEALTDVQHLLEESCANQHSEVRINAISAFKPQSPIGVSLVGAHEAIKLTRKWINPWRSANADRMAARTRSTLEPPAGSDEAAQGQVETLNDDLQGELTALATQIAAEALATASEALQRQCASALMAPLRELATNRLQILEEDTSR